MLIKVTAEFREVNTCCWSIWLKFRIQQLCCSHQTRLDYNVIEQETPKTINHFQVVMHVTMNIICHVYFIAWYAPRLTQCHNNIIAQIMLIVSSGSQIIFCIGIMMLCLSHSTAKRSLGDYNMGHLPVVKCASTFVDMPFPLLPLPNNSMLRECVLGSQKGALYTCCFSVFFLWALLSNLSYIYIVSKTKLRTYTWPFCKVFLFFHPLTIDAKMQSVSSSFSSGVCRLKTDSLTNGRQMEKVKGGSTAVLFIVVFFPSTWSRDPAL